VNHSAVSYICIASSHHHDRGEDDFDGQWGNQELSNEEPEALEELLAKRMRRVDERRGGKESEGVRVEKERQRGIVEQNELAKQRREKDDKLTKPIEEDQSLAREIHGYTVGWICALPIEMAAAKAMLDEVHGRPRDQHRSDTNNYLLGSIGQHNIVVSCLPNGVYGANSAAAVVSQMLSSFASIRISLLVGIGGGIPSKDCDIRLGDVVVSTPGKTHGGVVQYDFGKTVEGGQFTHIGSLNKPPPILLKAVASLQADHELEESKIPQFLAEMLLRYPKMQAEFTYQGASNDQLFLAEYNHVRDDSTCESCDVGKAISRKDRNTNVPFIHYGVIASGNQVIKHGVTRDRLRKEFEVICFEMEAAGLMDNFPCPVVRGISDYADSHKNKRWQKYAAAAAAAYAKEILEVIPPAQVDEAPTAADFMKSQSVHSN
jgi:nucleoside phosphorylase